jgi:chemotaxis protein methyltransferase CheR
MGRVMSVRNEPELKMTLDEFHLIRDFIHEKSGIFFADNKQYLIKNRLVRRMAELDITSVRDYFYHVKYDMSRQEFNRLIDLVTTNETSFFRNEPQLKSFAEEALPSILKAKRETAGAKTLRIWSAGCSTGEEPYTLAILVLETLKQEPDWSLEIIANDISQEVLHRARVGTYGGNTLRNIPSEFLARYFDARGNTYTVKPDIKALVKFSQMNLSDLRAMSMVSNADVIFCRNVMIYFSEEAKRRTVRAFYNALRPGGYFYIGHSETLHGISKAFKLVYLKNALVYRKDIVGPSDGAEHPASGSKPEVNATRAGGTVRAVDMLRAIGHGESSK